jgi:hypothetical protein
MTCDNPNISTAELEASHCHSVGEYRRCLWATVLGLVPQKDGNKWFILYGDSIQSGIAAFGDTPEDAITKFDSAMRSPGGAA